MATSLLLISASALSINEVELNPEGQDSQNEWVELYSEEEFDLTGYYIKNSDGNVFNLTGTFSGYLIIKFNTQWLDNSNETIYLIDSANVIDETLVLADSKNDDFTWNNCEGEWNFIKSTKNEKNGCTENEQNNPEQNFSRQNIPEGNQENLEDNQVMQEEQTAANENDYSESQPQNANSEKIVLNRNKNGKPATYLETQEYDFRLWIAYGFALLCVFIIIFLSLRKL